VQAFAIRKATGDDLGEILRLLKSAALWLEKKNVHYWQDWIRPPHDFVRWIAHGVENGEFHLVVGEGEVIGCYRLQWKDEVFWGEQTEKAGYLHSFTIDRKFSGRKIGESVLRTVEEACRERSKKYLRLDCGSDVPALRKYYEGQGFLPVGETVVRGEKLTLYEKALVPPGEPSGSSSGEVPAVSADR
jgi:N-acetylglutamate synthase-like GNAT family acetyltransferase